MRSYSDYSHSYQTKYLNESDLRLTGLLGDYAFLIL